MKCRKREKPIIVGSVPEFRRTINPVLEQEHPYVHLSFYYPPEQPDLEPEITEPEIMKISDQEVIILAIMCLQEGDEADFMIAWRTLDEIRIFIINDRAISEGFEQGMGDHIHESLLLCLENESKNYS